MIVPVSFSQGSLDHNEHVGFSYYSVEILELVSGFSRQVRKASEDSAAAMFIRNVSFQFILEVRSPVKFTRQITVLPNGLSDTAIDVVVEYFLGGVRCTKISMTCVISRLEKGANAGTIRALFLEKF